MPNEIVWPPRQDATDVELFTAIVGGGIASFDLVDFEIKSAVLLNDHKARIHSSFIGGDFVITIEQTKGT